MGPYQRAAQSHYDVPIIQLLPNRWNIHSTELKLVAHFVIQTEA